MVLLSATQKLLGFGVFELNLDTEELSKSGVVVKLPPQPFKLLVLLASNAGQVVARDEIQQQLWVGETFVDFEHGVNKCINQIRTALGDDADRPIYVQTLPRRGYRFVAPVVSRTLAAPQPKVIEAAPSERSPLPVLIGGRTGAAMATAELAAASHPAAVRDVKPAAEPATEVNAAEQTGFRWSRARFAWIGLVVLLVGAAGLGLYWRWRPQKVLALTEKDTIVLADFDNKTGDPVFDNTLKQGLDIQLEQSPFLNLISQDKVNQTLKLMGRSADGALTPEVARDLCQRTSSKAMLTGSIDQLGTQYVIGLKAVNCQTGDVLAEEQEQAAEKEAVLKALDAAAISLRSKLGESLSSVQRYATPLEEATTPSLEALKAYSQGREMSFTKGHDSALPFYKRAVELDPNFASAYAAISRVYFIRAEVGLAAENARKAYELRQKVSERERLHIEALYYTTATGELEKAAQVLDLYQQTYPRDFWPWAESGFVSASLGDWEKALQEARETIRLEPKIGVDYTMLAICYANLNRLDEAEAAYKQAEEHKIGSDGLLPGRYLLAFLKGDTAKMASLVSAAMGKPGTEDVLLGTQADTEGWYGRLKNASELTRRAMDSALHNDAKEAAALTQATAALREVEAGYGRQARADADAAMKLAPNRDVRAKAALALARAGDTAPAEKLAAELDKAFPLDTIVQRYWLPTIRAAVALQHKDPNRAVELLKAASPIELGQSAQDNVFLCPVYLRGEAYLMLGDGNAAAAEFQKFIDHYGLVVNFPWGALARLGLARAYALEATTDPAAHEKARAAYQSFLTLWKDADPDIPILVQAKVEYAKFANDPR